MCFQLYAATVNALPRRKWLADSSDLPVESLSEREAPIKLHFSNPEIQHIGSTSGCSCDFPNLTYQGGDWPSVQEEVLDEEQAASDSVNREGLVNVLRASGDRIVELYGIWDGDFEKAPAAGEEIYQETKLKPEFRFKKQGFYRVLLES